MNSILPVDIGSRREMLWDDYLLDTSRTSAERKLHQPRIEEIALVHDAPWEGDGCNSHSIIKDGDLYRMYYLGWQMLDESVTKHSTGQTVICYAESRDGLHWKKPSLGICEFDGNADTNIILDENNSDRKDMMYVFIDPNPACPADEKYKAISKDTENYLACYVSDDGIHFRKGWQMTNQGRFDTQNIAMWVPEIDAYMAYIRDYHERPSVYGSGAVGNERIRDVRWMTSPDFKSWTEPCPLDFGGGEDYPLYVNAVQRYYRAPHQFIGFPSRYVERKEWTPNYDQLAGADLRRKITGVHPRYGLTTTDCVFMTSRDGKNWQRYDEAFIRPGIERVNNWVYGDCFVAPAMIETGSALENAPDELSLFCYENHWRMIPARLRRYTIRVDGFASLHAGYAEKSVITKPLVFDGQSLEINFSTSARGSLYVIMHGPDKVLYSCELFGDTLSRKVPLDGDIADLAGKEVILEFIMRDADLYSFRFVP